MTKKDFIAIALILKDQVNRGSSNDSREVVLLDVAKELAVYFYTQNPRFDRDRFLKACGV